MVYAAVMGYGTIGSGVVRVIQEHGETIRRKTGQVIRIKYILDLRDFPDDPYNDLVIHDVDTIINDPEVSIVVETMGGTHPAFDFVKKAICAGKSVCTSNKELVAAYGVELLRDARDHDVNFLFEASVGGGIPIIRPLNTALTADRITGIQGILNGTTNYILTRMEDEGLGFEEVLKDAQKLGYAERNPSADVDGFDACRKIAILASIMTGKYVNYEDVPTKGITDITIEDMRAAAAEGKAIKLIARAEKTADGLKISVGPEWVPNEDELASVHGVFNAVVVQGSNSDKLMYYGSGAGKMPTASAVVADICHTVDAIPAAPLWK